jgi:anaerobic magnesium-protoporphyrin IX monomethyl ester cyclase
VDVLNDELLYTMKRAGCHTLSLGVETANDAVNQAFSKGINREQVKQTFILCKKNKIRTMAHFILGLPGETHKSILQTIEFALEIDPFYASFNIAEAPESTTFGEEYREQFGKQEKQLDELSYPYPECSTIPLKETLALRKLAIRKFYFQPRKLLQYIRSIKSPYEIKKLVNNGSEMLKRYILPRVLFHDAWFI